MCTFLFKSRRPVPKPLRCPKAAYVQCPANFIQGSDSLESHPHRRQRRCPRFGPCGPNPLAFKRGKRQLAPLAHGVPALEGLPGSAAGAACPAGLHSVLGSAFWGSPLSHVPLFGKALWRCVRQLQMAGPRFLMLPLSYGLLSSAIHRVIMRVAGVRIHPYRE